MAERLRAIPYDVLQQFITDSPWDWEIMQQHLVDMVRDHVADGDGLVNIDDTAFVKAGEHSVGVAPQYCGQLGKVANCQVGVACVYVRQHPERSADAGVFPLRIQLYLPEDWVQDEARRREVRVPDDVTFLKKWEIGLKMVDTIRTRGVPHGQGMGNLGNVAGRGRVDAGFLRSERRLEGADRKVLIDAAPDDRHDPEDASCPAARPSDSPSNSSDSCRDSAWSRIVMG